MAPTSDYIVNLKKIVSELTRQNTSSRQNLERTFGVKFIRDGESSFFSFWRADNVDIHGLRADQVSYREPIDGAGATSGSLLLIKLDKNYCIERSELLKVFPSIKPDSAPPAADDEPQQYFSDETTEAVLSFGFPVNSDDCINEIVYSLKRP